MTLINDLGNWRINKDRKKVGKEILISSNCSAPSARVLLNSEQSRDSSLDQSI